MASNTIAEGILTAWEAADLVCLGETHGSQADAAVRAALVEHPDFLATVDVIVLESATSLHQQLLDRFILHGEELTREELQPTWRDAGRGVFWQLPIYEEFLPRRAAGADTSCWDRACEPARGWRIFRRSRL